MKEGTKQNQKAEQFHDGLEYVPSIAIQTTDFRFEAEAGPSGWLY
jgi:hypothetical protein